MNARDKNTKDDDAQSGSPKLSPIATALERLLRGMEDLREAAVIAAPALATAQKSAFEKQRATLQKYTKDDPTTNTQTAIAYGPHAASELTKASNEYKRLRESKAVKVLMRSLFIGIFSEFDVFMGELLQSLYEAKPELFKGIKREITLSELLEFPSVDAVKQDTLEKEIDAFRRNSYIEQFVELETKFKISTLRTFEEWPLFVEMGQRRNLLTHNGGMCSEQYLSVCEKIGYKFESKPNCGDNLMPSGRYFGNARFVVAKVAFMLTHTLWRKLLPDEVAAADEAMNETIFQLLSKEWWRHGSEFGKFGLSEPMVKKATDIDKRVRVINTAIGLKNLKKNEEVVKVLHSMDWTASLRDFQLAISILSDDYKMASELMRSIGKKGEMVHQLAYHTWPLFHEFRDSIEFQTAYEEVYGIPFLEGAAKDAQTEVIEGDKLITIAKDSDQNVVHESSLNIVSVETPDTDPKPIRKRSSRANKDSDKNVVHESSLDTVSIETPHANPKPTRKRSSRAKNPRSNVDSAHQEQGPSVTNSTTK